MDFDIDLYKDKHYKEVFFHKSKHNLNGHIRLLLCLKKNNFKEHFIKTFYEYEL